MNPSRLALVLAGGGARGAYEAGALRFILGDLSRRLGSSVVPRIISGTSVGAINGGWVAAHLDDADCAHFLSDFWREITLEEVYRFVTLDILRSPMRIFRGTTDDSKALVDASPLHALIREKFPAQRLRKVVKDGHLDALVLAATEVVSGRCVHFLDGGRAQDITPSTEGHIRIHTEITADHILASCAIPFLFPPIPVEGHSFVDGSLRQNTPLRPALALGATHCLVIGTKGERPQVPLPDSGDASVPFLLGKTLNALLLDPVHADMKRLELVNKILQTGRSIYGPEFADKMSPGLQSPLREIEVLYLQPSRDLGRIAAETWDPDALQANRGTRLLLSTIADRSIDGEADLLSYLLFDQTFTCAIEELGYSDAAQREEEIATFLLAATRSAT